MAPDDWQTATEAEATKKEAIRTATVVTKATAAAEVLDWSMWALDRNAASLKEQEAGRGSKKRGRKRFLGGSTHRHRSMYRGLRRSPGGK